MKTENKGQIDRLKVIKEKDIYKIFIQKEKDRNMYSGEMHTPEGMFIGFGGVMSKKDLLKQIGKEL